MLCGYSVYRLQDLVPVQYLFLYLQIFSIMPDFHYENEKGTFEPHDYGNGLTLLRTIILSLSEDSKETV